MADAGDTYTNPVNGERLVFTTTSGQTGGCLLRVRLTSRSGWASPPRHVHPAATERFMVHEGALRIATGRSMQVVHAGEELTAPPGVAHGYEVHGECPATFDVELTPARNMEQFFERVYRLAEAGGMDSTGQPSLLRIAPIAAEHVDDVALPGVPLPVQRLLLRLLAPLGRLRYGTPP